MRIEIPNKHNSNINFVFYFTENGYKHLKFHIEGADLNKYNRGELERLRSKIASELLHVPPEFVIVAGIEPSSSLMITIMLLEDDAIRLVSFPPESLAVLSDMFVNYIMIGETFIPVSGIHVFFIFHLSPFSDTADRKMTCKLEHMIYLTWY